ncbi:hypothetical protein F0358_15105 [Empedobacter brevis]|uniref:hypothetical protein n=1 Tax=Empedobacter brevis TaxID=247 RepID=UPI00123D8A26|nr:hypothetical protein [Empedobacter brevis]QES93949.1 hypothetical protein F0358_15105 [Empedobacter brevis]
MKIDTQKLRGKTRKEIIEILGRNFHKDSTNETLIFTINRSLLNWKGTAFVIEFNSDGIADTFYSL